MLPLIDVLSIHCPYLPSTRHLISKSEIAMMQNTAVIINTARGGIVDEDALLIALKEGKLGGAGLDVFEEEPLRFENYRELLELDNVIGLPHLGGSTDEVTRVGCMKAVDQLADYLDGKGAANRVY
jgi:D-3-phosphoglycerate dehydrogenase / 2-oxoglutarate reductase